MAYVIIKRSELEHVMWFAERMARRMGQRAILDETRVKIVEDDDPRVSSNSIKSEG